MPDEDKTLNFSICEFDDVSRTHSIVKMMTMMYFWARALNNPSFYGCHLG